MAKAKKPVEPVDEFGVQLEDTNRANAALLSGLKYDYGQKLLLAQKGEGDYPTPFELQAIKKLETEIQSDALFAEARRLTLRGAA